MSPLFGSGVALGVCTLAGICLVLSFPDRSWWWLAPVGVALSALAARGRTARAGALLGFVTGLAFFVPHLSWSGVYVGLLPWTALAVSQAAFFALMGALLPAAWRAPGRSAGTVVAISGLWVAQEALRGRIPFGGFPWGRLAFSQADSPALNLAWLGGAPLVSAAVAASGALLAVAAVGLGHALRPTANGRAARRPDASVGHRSAVLAAILAVLVMAAGLLIRLDAGGPRSAQVLAVQGNVPRAGLDFNAERRAVLDNHASATIGHAARVRAGRAPAPDLVVWPENSSDIDPLRNPDAYAVISRATDAVGVPLLVGAVLREPVDHVSNAGVVWNPRSSADPGPGERYVKRHPAPFAEYIPYRSFFRLFSDKVDLVVRDFAKGSEVGVLEMGPARVGDIICFEVVYDSLVSDTVRAGADLLVVQTNNATFGFTDESSQQFAMSRLRAVETGRSVVHISTVGISGLIAADGTVLAQSGHFTQEVLTQRLALRTDMTPATTLRAIPEAILAVVGLMLVAVGLRGGRRGPQRGNGAA